MSPWKPLRWQVICQVILTYAFCSYVLYLKRSSLCWFFYWLHVHRSTWNIISQSALGAGLYQSPCAPGCGPPTRAPTRSRAQRRVFQRGLVLVWSSSLPPFYLCRVSLSAHRASSDSYTSAVSLSITSNSRYVSVHQPGEPGQTTGVYLETKEGRVWSTEVWQLHQAGQKTGFKLERS